MKLETSCICEAFQDGPSIGTKVTNPDLFYAFVMEAIENHDPSNDRAEGQHFILLPKEASQYVLPGVGRRTQNIEDYVIRFWRGQAGVYLKRVHAVPVEQVALVAFTRDAYLGDPDVTSEFPGEAERIAATDATHIIVVVLAPSSPFPPRTLVHNLAGGNKGFTAEKLTVQQIIDLAVDSDDYWAEYCVVAD